ncbi:FAD-dependent monooxygenase [Streptomyces sp. NPDC091272]|uniref:FAD-dependent monooxygenase n=1 Tax=Streptomyces sp. NPDC091272 TaxID=3365981 RepID=UPI0037F218E3
MLGRKSVLVSGASIAGPALSWWLGAAGWDVTVVERFDRLREEGQNVDVRGVGRTVLRRMGLEEAVRAAHTGETGTDFIDGRGRPYASFAAGADDTGGLTAELEILRGRLARILHNHSAGSADYVFGDRISALHDDGHGVDVEFVRSAGRRFDVVVLAEGLRSRSRDLIMPDAPVHELGLYTAHLTLPRTAADDDRWRVFAAGRGRQVSLRPDSTGGGPDNPADAADAENPDSTASVRAFLSLVSDVRGLDRLDTDALVAVLRGTFADAGWETPRILDALDNGSLYFDAVGQVKLPVWSRGRVALLGDAAYCPSPISGMGTTLALAGAYVLAGELNRHDTPRTAFTRYEQLLRPLVERAQKLPPGAPRIAHPRTGPQQALFRAVLRAAATPLAGRLSSRAGALFTPPAEAIALPHYPAPGRPSIAP